MRQSVAEVGLHVFRLNRVQGFGDPPQLQRAALRLDEAGHMIIERHHANAVAVRLSDPREHQRRVDRVVQLVKGTGGRGHQATAVDRDDHLLPALGFDLDHHGPIAPRCGRPAHPAHVISAHVVAQARKRGRRSGRPRPSHARHRTQATPE